MVRRTREEAEQTRCLLLDTAEQLFSVKGVSKTTLADIATAAGLTRGAVYWHFENKLDLYRAMLDRVAPAFDTIRTELLTAAAADPAQALWAHSLNVNRVIASEPQIRRILLILLKRSEHVDELAPIHDECVAHMREGQDVLRQIFQLACDRHQTLPHVDPTRAAGALQSSHNGMIDLSLEDSACFDLEHQAGDVLAYLYRGLFRSEVLENLSPRL